MDKRISITFDFTQGKIVVEGQEGDLMKIAQEAKVLAPALSEIRVITQTVKPSEADLTVQQATPPIGMMNRSLSMREFAKSLPLSSVYEKIAALAYHAIRIQGKQTFSNSEINDWFGLCGFPKPAKMAVALNDARRYRDYVENKGRGLWTLTTAGENLIIEMLEKQKR